VDLSKVMFICTANTLELTGPLLNRLELIEVPGYTREEKYEIAVNHLIPNQIKENGAEGLIEFKPDGIREIIKYTT
jgi:ATP-dependent Lon protease